MLYTSDFISVNGNKYTVNIVTNGDDSTSREILLGVPPFTTQMDDSNENIYKPIRCQSATVNIVTNDESDYMFDLYSGEANGTRVTLTRSGQTIWDGFATPVIYNNGYSNVHENLNLECIDGLSVLQYYKYSADNKQVIKLIDVLNKVLQKSEVYTYLYVSTNTKLTSVSSTPILNELYISEKLFFDKKNDKETDDDVAWTCKEVLEEICKYLGLVAVANGNSVYLIDYDALKANNKTFTKYTIGSTTYTTETLSQTVEIGLDLYRGANNTISLDNVYNKVSVKDSFYTFESVIPDLYETATNITKDTDDSLTGSTQIENGMYGEVVSGNDGNMEVLIDRVYDPEEEIYTKYNAVFVKYYTNNNYNFTCPSQVNYTDTKTMHGSFIGKFSVTKLDPWFSWIEKLVIDIYLKKYTLDDWLARNSLSNPTFTNYVCLLNPHENHVESGATWITTNNSDMSAMFGGKNSYLLIKGSYIYHNVDEDPYPIPSGEVDISEGRYAMAEGQTYLLAKLKWGSQYWNGSGWTASNSTFKIPYMRDDSSDSDRRADATMFADLDFTNTVSWRIGTNEKGLLIPTPDDNKVMVGLPEFTLYSPIDPDYYSTKSGDFEGKHYKHTRVFLKNFDIIALIGDPSYENVNDSDTVYTNVINNNHVQEFDEVEFKICTNDGKSPNYSSVAYKNGTDYYFLDKTYNQALSANNRQEEHLINRFCKQYKEPRIRLNLELTNTIEPWAVLSDKWLHNKMFLVDCQNIDYYNDKTDITLIEKA